MNPENLFDIDVPQLIYQLQGILASGQGYGPEFTPVIETTIQLLGDVQGKRANSQTYFSLGECFLQLEDTKFAEKAFQTSWMLEPTNLQAGTYLGLCLEQAGNLEQAIETYFTLVKIDSQNVEMANHVMQLIHQQNNIEKLFSYAEQLIELNPKLSAPFYYRSKCYFAAGNIKQALEEISSAHELEPTNAEYLELYLYFAYLEEQYHVVLKFDTQLMSDTFAITSRLMLPNAYAADGQLKRARDLYAAMFCSTSDMTARIQVAIEIALFHASHEHNVAQSNRVNKWIVKRDPNNSVAWSNLANNTSHDYLKLEYFEKAHNLDPNNHALAMNYGSTLMNLGKLEEGFELYDRRRHLLNQSIANIINYSEDLHDKKVFVWTEQGLGDVYIWSWLLQQLARQTSHAKVQCEPRLKTLLSRSFPEIQFIDKNLHQIAESEDLNDFDANLLLISLGKYFYQGIYDIQNGAKEVTPALKADDALVEKFHKSLCTDDKRPLVGVCWRSSVSDYKRSNSYLSHDDVIDIFKDLPCRVLNLQYNSSPEEIATLNKALPNQFVDLEQVDLKDDQESVAALIMVSTLVLSVPTAVFALTGALGKRLLSTSGTYFLGRKKHAFFPNTVTLSKTIGTRDEIIEHYKNCLLTELSNINQ